VSAQEVQRLSPKMSSNELVKSCSMASDGGYGNFRVDGCVAADLEAKRGLLVIPHQ
jgi:hypothetical protein